jgi:hypothetical protein
MAIRAKKSEASKRRNIINHWNRKKLFKLWKKRHGGDPFLTNDDDGHAMLMVLVRFWISADEAMERARWLTETELKKIKRAAWLVDRDKLGSIIHLSYAERDYAKLWTLLPEKMTREQIDKLQRVRDRENAKKRKRRERERVLEGINIMKQTTEREMAIKVMLDLAALPSRHSGPTIPPYRGWMPGWISAPEVVKQASACRAFRSPDEQPLRNLRDAVHVTLKRLAERGEVTLWMRNGARGPVCFVKLPDPANLRQRDTDSDCRSVGGRISAKEQQKMLEGQRLKLTIERRKGMSRSDTQGENRTHTDEATSSSVDTAPTVPSTALH